MSVTHSVEFGRVVPRLVVHDAGKMDVVWNPSLHDLSAGASQVETANVQCNAAQELTYPSALFRTLWMALLMFYFHMESTKLS